MTDMQGTYQYWGARLFSYMKVAANSTYSFVLQADSSARLWVEGTLLINATCRSLTHTLNCA